MSKLILLENVTLAFGLEPLLDKIKLQIASQERVCLIGRNGAGKSSLLKMIEGNLLPDSGTIWRKPGLKIARLEQALPQSAATQSTFEFVASGLAEMGALILQYHQLTQNLSHDHSPQHLKKLEKIQHEIETNNAWQLENNILTILSKLDLDPETKLVNLSGGWQRRAALAKALVIDPDLLLLDEPTNHLDIEAINWLEKYLLDANFSLLFITHDRALLSRLATRIIELDRGQLTSWECNYTQFLERKAAMLEAEAKQHADFDKKLAQEEVWVRQGIKARRTRNEGRVRALEAMRVEQAKRREVEGKVNFQQNTTNLSGQLVIEAKHISQQYDNKNIIDDFSVRIMRGDHIGIIGQNGAGKSTLLNILLGNQPPQQGYITLGTKLEVGYFDQLRAALDLEKTVAENVVHGSDFIELDNKRLHIISYLGQFLFSPQRAMTPVKALSGGECNRLLLARLFSKPTNLLVLDEPTNDLDIETLELLEELLMEYKGTLLLVSHDRAFLDNVVTSTLVFTGNGKIQECVGGYSDALKYIKTDNKPDQVNLTPTSTVKKQDAKKKLSFKENEELKMLPARIESLERELADQQTLVASPTFYEQDQEKVADGIKKIADLEIQIEKIYARWHELEQKL